LKALVGLYEGSIVTVKTASKRGCIYPVIIFNKLIKEGLVERRKGGGNHASYRLTEKGKNFIESILSQTA
jgi:DNA-binding PadR family transcriptional regulator